MTILRKTAYTAGYYRFQAAVQSLSITNNLLLTRHVRNSTKVKLNKN